jgi:hypothetical protein
MFEINNPGQNNGAPSTIDVEQYTLTYDKGVQGWVSFYSYFPDYMIGMNNYFYTFKGGDLYRHNTGANRNTFYGTAYKSTLRSVINESPSENKLFKTFMLEGDDSWNTTIVSDQQNTGYILVNPDPDPLVNADYYTKKEGAYFGYIRNSGNTLTDQFDLRSMNGLADSQTIGTAGSTTTIEFADAVTIGGIMSVGDKIYFGEKSGTEPNVDIINILLLGSVSSIHQGKLNGNKIEVDNTGGSIPTTNDYYILYIKDSVAESHGILGHFAVFDLELHETKAILKSELFLVESDVMKSYP